MPRLLAVVLCYAFFACQSAQAKNVPAERRLAQAKDAAAPAAPAEPGATPTEPAAKPVIIRRAFLNPYENDAFVQHIDAEHKRFGTADRVKRYKKKKYGATIIEQRSGRKRLFDHNIFLRAMFAGQLLTDPSQNLKEQFEGAIFLDIGSAILFGDGANTVRDLYEDKMVSPHLKIIASDINDSGSKKNRYVDIYRKSGEKLPFPVVEVPAMMNKPEHFLNPLKLFMTPETAAIILRSANAGPDLYYDTREVQRHLRSAAAAFYKMHVLYFFNKYILYKPREQAGFIIIGEIDPEVGINHRETTWEDIDWSARTFNEAIRLNPQYVEYQK